LPDLFQASSRLAYLADGANQPLGNAFSVHRSRACFPFVQDLAKPPDVAFGVCPIIAGHYVTATFAFARIPCKVRVHLLDQLAVEALEFSGRLKARSF
jgi:hypothetical protein